jgi:hypothetical protein
MNYEHSCQLELAGSQRHWAGPGSILNFGIFELKLQNFVHPSIWERFECGLWNQRLLYKIENYGNLVSESASWKKKPEAQKEYHFKTSSHYYLFS